MTLSGQLGIAKTRTSQPHCGAQSVADLIPANRCPYFGNAGL